MSLRCLNRCVASRARWPFVWLFGVVHALGPSQLVSCRHIDCEVVGRATPELFEALLTASPDAVVLIDSGGRIEMASPAVEAMFGYRAEELVGEPVEILVPDELRMSHEGHRARYLENPTTRAMGSGLPLFGRRCDGSTFPVDVSLAPVRLGTSQRVGAFVRDATERRRGEDLLRHVNEISGRLLALADPEETLGLTARHARSLVGAATAWIVLRAREGLLAVAAADGAGAEELVGVELREDGSLSGRVLAEDGPVAVRDMSAEDAVIPEGRRLGLGPGLYVPMRVEEGPIGTVVVGRAAGGAAFDAADLRTLETFAGAASVAISLNRARRDLERLKLVSEHDRIARDLHDTVIQRLFALGMSLQGLQRLAEGIVGERLEAAVETIDHVIREIRETIFDLSRPDVGGPDIRRQVRKTAAEAAPQLGFEPRVAFRGPVEAEVYDELVPHLVAVVREALSNAARHAKAQSVEVILAANNGWLTLSVADDGVGIPPGPSAGHGLANMGNRAEQLGGDLRLIGLPAGTLVEWRVPTRAS